MADFNVIFEGKIEKETENKLAKLLKKKIEQVRNLLKNGNKITLKGLSYKQVNNFQKIIEDTGVTCQIVMVTSDDNDTSSQTKTCPKCAYRITTKNSLNQECPKCGIIISKYQSKIEKNKQISSNSSLQKQSSKEVTLSFNNFFINFIGLQFFLHDSVELFSNLKPASIAQRFWASVASWFYFGFILHLLTIPFSIFIYIFTTLKPAFRLELLVILVVLGSFLVSFIIIPLLWKGHTFGQRMMGIVLIQTKELRIGLSPYQVLLRAFGIIVKCFYFISLIVILLNKEDRSLEDLMSKTRQVAVQNIPESLWSRIWLPIFAAMCSMIASVSVLSLIGVSL